ncbi:MAG: hypothetical protein J1G38_04625 [Clostridiales bacterium]|nr:hypothetical protein [Clostridiales bacterium]
MNTRNCALCGKTIPADQTLHCEHCDKCYCEECAHRLALCECAGELAYYD